MYRRVRQILFLLFACVLMGGVNIASVASSNWWGYGDASQRIYRYHASATCNWGDHAFCNTTGGHLQSTCNEISWNRPSVGYSYQTCTGFRGSILAYPVFPYIIPGSPYDKDSSCTISWRWVRLQQNPNAPDTLRWQQGSVIGMTAKNYGNWEAKVANCRNSLLELGKTWGYHSTEDFLYTYIYQSQGASDTYYGPYYKWCLYIDGQPVDASCPTTSYDPPPPDPIEPIACSVSVESTVDFGVLVSAELSSSRITHPINVTCSGAGTVYLSFSGGSGVSNSGIKFTMGGGLEGSACFADKGSCIKDGYYSSLSFDKSGISTVDSIFTLSPQGRVDPGSYSSSIILIMQTP